MPVRGGCRLGSGNRLVQSGPGSPFGRILSEKWDIKYVGRSKCSAHLRHESSYSPGLEITSSSLGSSSSERLMRQTAANSSPGSQSGNLQKDNEDKTEIKVPEVTSSSSSSREHSSTLACGPF